MKAETIVDTILGEAGGKSRASRYADMVAIAQTMENRSKMLNVPMKDTLVEFDAYGKSLPAGVSAYKSLAMQALQDVLANPTPYHAATFYATPAAVANLPKGLKAEHSTTAHSYFSDPQNRAIGTAQGYKSPTSLEALGLLDTAPTAAPSRETSRGSSMAGPFGGNPFGGMFTEAMFSSPTISSSSRTPGFMTNPAITAPVEDFNHAPVMSFQPNPAYAPEDFGPSRAHNLGLAHGRPGYVAGVPAKSVTTTSIGRPSMSPAELASRYSPSSAASRLGVARSTDPASSRVSQAHAAGKTGPVSPAIAAALAQYAASKAPTTGRMVAAAPSVAATRGPAPAVMAYAPVAPAAKAPAAFAPAPTGPVGLLGFLASLFGPGAGMGGLGISGGAPGGPSAGNPGYGGAHGIGGGDPNGNYSGL